MTFHERQVLNAALYVVRTHIPLPMPKPRRGKSRTDALIRWGAIRHLHTQVANWTRAESARWATQSVPTGIS